MKKDNKARRRFNVTELLVTLYFIFIWFHGTFPLILIDLLNACGVAEMLVPPWRERIYVKRMNQLTGDYRGCTRSGGEREISAATAVQSNSGWSGRFPIEIYCLLNCITFCALDFVALYNLRSPLKIRNSRYDGGRRMANGDQKKMESHRRRYTRKYDLGQIDFWGFLSPVEDETSSQEVEDFRFRNAEMRAIPFSGDTLRWLCRYPFLFSDCETGFIEMYRVF